MSKIKTILGSPYSKITQTPWEKFDTLILKNGIFKINKIPEELILDNAEIYNYDKNEKVIPKISSYKSTGKLPQTKKLFIYNSKHEYYGNLKFLKITKTGNITGKFTIDTFHMKDIKNIASNFPQENNSTLLNYMDYCTPPSTCKKLIFENCSNFLYLSYDYCDNWDLRPLNVDITGIFIPFEANIVKLINTPSKKLLLKTKKSKVENKTSKSTIIKNKLEHNYYPKNFNMKKLKYVSKLSEIDVNLEKLHKIKFYNIENNEIYYGGKYEFINNKYFEGVSSTKYSDIKGYRSFSMDELSRQWDKKREDIYYNEEMKYAKKPIKPYKSKLKIFSYYKNIIKYKKFAFKGTSKTEGVPREIGEFVWNGLPSRKIFVEVNIDAAPDKNIPDSRNGYHIPDSIENEYFSLNPQRKTVKDKITYNNFPFTHFTKNFKFNNTSLFFINFNNEEIYNKKNDNSALCIVYPFAEEIGQDYYKNYKYSYKYYYKCDGEELFKPKKINSIDAELLTSSLEGQIITLTFLNGESIAINSKDGYKIFKDFINYRNKISNYTPPKPNDYKEMDIPYGKMTIEAIRQISINWLTTLIFPIITYFWGAYIIEIDDSSLGTFICMLGITILLSTIHTFTAALASSNLEEEWKYIIKDEREKIRKSNKNEKYYINNRYENKRI